MTLLLAGLTLLTLIDKNSIQLKNTRTGPKPSLYPEVSEGNAGQHYGEEDDDDCDDDGGVTLTLRPALC